MAEMQRLRDCSRMEVPAVDLDIMEKRRLASRRFGFVRHQVYRTKSLVEPARECVQLFADDEDRLDKDFERSLRADHERMKKRDKENRMIMGARQALREQQLDAEREKEWQNKLKHEHYLTTKPQRRNKGGEAYNLINMEYDHGLEGRRLKYTDDCARYREGMRRLRIQSRMSGTRNYNVISWQKARPMEVPTRPKPFTQEEEEGEPRPYTAPPTEPVLPVPIIAPGVARSLSTAGPGKNASENYHWDLDQYRHKPYLFK